MTLPEEYYIEAIKNNLFQKFKYFIALFTLSDCDHLKPIPFALTKKSGSYGYYDEELKVIDLKIKADKPLFRYKDALRVPKGTVANLDKDVDTSYGNLYVNAILSKYTSEIPFILGQINGGDLDDLEDKIATLLVDTPEGGGSVEGHITTDEYVGMMTDLQTLESLGQYVVQAATPRNIVPPPNLDKKKKELLAKYKDTLDDPTTQVKIVEELQKFDADWLNQDEEQNGVIGGGLRKVARTKMYLAVGSNPSFTPEMQAEFNLDSYADGIPDDLNKLIASHNTVRYASYARGSLTAIAGVLAKFLMQLLSPITVEDGDCGTTLCRDTMITPQYKKFVGRYYLVDKKPVLITKEIHPTLIGKVIPLRSPSYCKHEIASLCRVCAGENLWPLRKSLSIAGTALASITIYMYFGLLKQQEKLTSELQLEDLSK